MLGFDLTAFQSVVQHLKHWVSNSLIIVSMLFIFTFNRSLRIVGGTFNKHLCKKKGHNRFSNSFIKATIYPPNVSKLSFMRWPCFLWGNNSLSVNLNESICIWNSQWDCNFLDSEACKKGLKICIKYLIDWDSRPRLTPSNCKGFCLEKKLAILYLAILTH